jgi:AcrR family transcriptional regulator
MEARIPNDRLARLVKEAGFSRKSFARALRDASEDAGTPIGCDHTSVSRWLRGMQPRADAARLIIATLSRALGHPVTLSDAGLAPSARLPLDLGLAYPEALAEGMETVTQMWQADLDEASVVFKGKISAPSWNDASLKWLLATPPSPSEDSRGSRVGEADITRFRATIDLFAQMDNRFGGEHARRSFIHYLTADGTRLLRSQISEKTRPRLFSEVAEAILLAAWMSYDSDLHGLAQRYVIQALGLAQAANDRLLGGGILDAMSHQATFVGRYREAANLARAARQGTSGVATPTLTAHFHAMEARALARLGDALACDRALAQAVREFERRNPDDDPEWIRYFDDAELAAEFGHCFQDLGRPVVASQYATQCLGASGDGTYLRSDFFATMVLADAHLGAGRAEEACLVVLDALRLGEQLRSARCVSYLREFSVRLAPTAKSSGLGDFHEQAAGFSLWQQVTGAQ